VEATVLAGGPALEGSDSGHYAAAVLARLLSDPAAGRLARAFGAHPEWLGETGASLSRSAGAGFIQLSATVPVEIADSALLTVRQVAAQIRTGAIGESELARAREDVAGAFALRLQTAGQLAGAQAEARLLGLPPAYFASFRPRVMA
jgi:predicted Zn-dependent peptidase